MKILKLIAVVVAVLSMTLGIPAAVHAAPGAPSITFPTNGELLTVYTPPPLDFYWTVTAPSGGYYDIEISTDATFLNSAAIVDGTTFGHTKSCQSNSTQFISTYTYQPTTSYYVRIQAYDTTCNVGTNDFTTGGSGWADFVFYTSLTTPTLMSPGNTSTLVNNLTNDNLTGPYHPYPLFQWKSVAGATSYNLEVSTQTNFSSLYLNVNVPTSNTFIVGGGATVVGYTPSSDLPVDTTFYWQVEAVGPSYSPSGWGFCGSGNCSFNTGLAASPAPLPVQMPPVGKGIYTTGKVTDDFTPGLLWDEIALPGGTTFTTYEVQVSTDNTFLDTTALCFDVNSGQVSSLQYQTYPSGVGLTSVQFDTGIALAHAAPPPGSNCPTSGGLEFAPTTVYYWRVRAQDSGGYSDWSKVYYFKTSYSKVVSTTFTAIANPTNRTITFNWTKVPGAYAYSLQGCFDSLPNPCPLNVSKIEPPYIWWLGNEKRPVASGALIHWRVSAIGPFGPSSWSDPHPPQSDVTTP